MGTRVDPFHCSCAECLKKTQGQSTSSSPKQMSLVSESSSPKQMSLVPSPRREKRQLLFTPLMFASEPSGTLISSMLPVEILRKIGRFASVEAMRNLIATCKYIRNQPNTWFLQAISLREHILTEPLRDLLSMQLGTKATHVYGATQSFL